MRCVGHSFDIYSVSVSISPTILISACVIPSDKHTINSFYFVSYFAFANQIRMLEYSNTRSMKVQSIVRIRENSEAKYVRFYHGCSF